MKRKGMATKPPNILMKDLGSVKCTILAAKGVKALMVSGSVKV
jgi:hypothetical protein